MLVGISNEGRKRSSSQNLHKSTSSDYIPTVPRAPLTLIVRNAQSRTRLSGSLPTRNAAFSKTDIVSPKQRYVVDGLRIVARLVVGGIFMAVVIVVAYVFALAMNLMMGMS